MPSSARNKNRPIEVRFCFNTSVNEKHFAHRGQKCFRADVVIRPYDLTDKWQFYIIKYSARVKSALFRSSSQSPAINKSSSTTIRSPVSKSLGSSCFRNPPTLLSWRLFCGHGSFLGGGHTGSGGFGGQLSGFPGAGGLGGGACRVGSGTRLRANDPSG